MADYENNVANFDYKYLNKKIKVNGTIFAIGKISYLQYHVSLKTNDNHEFIHCIFKNNKIKMIVNLKENDKVTIQGKCMGSHGCGIIIDNCTLLNKEE